MKSDDLCDGVFEQVGENGIEGVDGRGVMK